MAQTVERWRVWRANNSERWAEICRRSYLKRRTAILARRRQHYLANPELYRAQRRRNYLKNRVKIRTANSVWRAANRGKDAASRRRQLEGSPVFRLKLNLRRRLRGALKPGTVKAAETFTLVGCTPDFLKRWLEKQFQPGMSWTNHGDWHIDHKRPCASFDLADPAQQRACFHYTNLRPLWAEENILKGAQWTN